MPCFIFVTGSIDEADERLTDFDLMACVEVWVSF